MALVFEQQPKESDKAFAAFAIYLSMGPERSLVLVGRKLGKSVGLMERWSKRRDWPGRVAAHSAHLAIVEREATEALTRGKAAQWVKRQEEHRDEEWALRGELIAAGRKVLKRFTEQDRGATLGDVARALELASKLGRLAAGMATDKTELTGEDGGPIRVELAAALSKVYGVAAPPGIIEAEATVAPMKEIGNGESGIGGFRQDAEMGGRDDRATLGGDGEGRKP